MEIKRENKSINIRWETYASTGKNDYLYTATQPERYPTTGNERDQETQLDYRQARFYSSERGRFLSVDPKWDAAPGWTPFRYGFDNPIKFNDPNGLFEAPIYRRYGDFLGTDDGGLQGKAIVMRKKDFVQGMSHSLAKKNNLGKNGFLPFKAYPKLSKHFKGLKVRPDYDGLVTIDDGVSWAKKRPNTIGNNDPNDAFYLDALRLNYGQFTVSDLKDLGFVNGSSGNVNLLDFVSIYSRSSRATVYALGNTRIQLLDEKLGTIRLFSDQYDWDFHNYSLGEILSGKMPKSHRDRLIALERKRKGLNDSHGFNVFIYGIGTIDKD